MKKLICFIFGHKWTSKALRGNEVKKGAKPEDIISLFKEHAWMYCGRCGKASELNKKVEKY